MVNPNMHLQRLFSQYMLDILYWQHTDVTRIYPWTYGEERSALPNLKLHETEGQETWTHERGFIPPTTYFWLSTFLCGTGEDFKSRQRSIKFKNILHFLLAFENGLTWPLVCRQECTAKTSHTILWTGYAWHAYLWSYQSAVLWPVYMQRIKVL